MPDSSKPAAQSTLGYLAAFTLGVICMGAILFFTRQNTRIPDAVSKVPEREDPAPRIHFQRANPSADLRESLQLPRASARPITPVQRAVAEQPSFSESAQDDPAPVQEPLPEPSAEFVPPRAAAVPVPVAVAADALPNGARVSGRVFLMFKPPPERPLPLDAQCAAEFRRANMPPTTRFYVVGRDNGLANVFVMVVAGLPDRKWPVRRQPVSLRLRGCIYENPVAGVQTGQRLLVANLDRVMHNVHNLPERNREGNFAMLPRTRDLEFVFNEPEMFMRFKCDVHPWEFAYVSVMEHPFFAVTDGNGNFAIDGLPPGRYTLEAHHRKAGILRREINVEEFRNTSADFHFRPPAEPQNI